MKLGGGIVAGKGKKNGASSSSGSESALYTNSGSGFVNYFYGDSLIYEVNWDYGAQK
jgi:hypothetical protein